MGGVHKSRREGRGPQFQKGKEGSSNQVEMGGFLKSSKEGLGVSSKQVGREDSQTCREEKGVRSVERVVHVHPTK